MIFGVGRPTIQHALRLLAADRLVEARRGRRGGTFVSEPAEDAGAMDELMTRVLRRRKELVEVLVYRRSIEPKIARQAALNRQRSDLTAIGAAIERMSTAQTDPEYMRYDTEFHLAVADRVRRGLRGDGAQANCLRRFLQLHLAWELQEYLELY